METPEEKQERNRQYYEENKDPISKRRKATRDREKEAANQQVGESSNQELRDGLIEESITDKHAIVEQSTSIEERPLLTKTLRQLRRDARGPPNERLPSTRTLRQLRRDARDPRNVTQRVENPVPSTVLPPSSPLALHDPLSIQVDHPPVTLDDPMEYMFDVDFLIEGEDVVPPPTSLFPQPPTPDDMFDEDFFIQGEEIPLPLHTVPPPTMRASLPSTSLFDPIFDENYLINEAVQQMQEDVFGYHDQWLYDNTYFIPDDLDEEDGGFLGATLDMSSATNAIEQQQRISALPLARRPLDPQMGRHKLGRMTIECSHCKALHWLEERKVRSTISNPMFGLCCADGKVYLPSVGEPPEPLKGLLTKQDVTSTTFRKNIRAYNNALAFTSIGVKYDQRGSNQGPFSFRIQGALYHRVGSLLPPEGQNPKFAQLYIHDTANELDNRMTVMTNLDQNILAMLQEMLHRQNPYARMFKNAGALIEQQEGNIALRIIADRNSDPRRYNKPSADDIGAIMVSEEEGESGPRDIILRKANGTLQRISEWHRAYAPLHYVLLFPMGQDGWSYDIPLQGHGYQGGEFVEEEPGARQGRGGSKKITQLQYFAYRLHARMEEGKMDDWLLRGGRLLKQYIVDAYACIDQTRLTFLRNNQKKLRIDLYTGLQDAVRSGDTTASQLGKSFILPSSHAGSQRNIMQSYQDAMAVVRTYGKPDIFLTFTCNPEWPEIQDECFEGQRPSDRDDIISRVFKLKLTALLADIKAGVLGRPIASMYVIEFQKRGLPHAHILIILCQEHKIRSPEEVDQLVCAEIPDENKYQGLYATITRCMAHGPCGLENPKAPCMSEDKKCTKEYPRKFNGETKFHSDGYPEYRRRDNGSSFMKDGRGFKFDNRWIVPYNPYLSAKYNAHINVEICSSFKAIKYLFKYVYKGLDRAIVEMEAKDELKQYLDARYVSAPEGVWRILQFKMHENSVSIQRLQVHCPHEQSVVFNEDADIIDVVDRAASKHTTLTAFFEANAQFEAARQLTYTNFPSEFVWNQKLRKWTPRTRGFAIGRMYFVPLSAGERYYLRALLIHVKGPQSFEDLRRFDGVLYSTFKEAALARGLYKNDEEWDRCLEEAAALQTGDQLRKLFITIILYGVATEPDLLWSKHAEHLSDDCSHRLQSRGIENPSMEHQQSLALHLIQRALQSVGKTLQQLKLPLPTYNFEEENNGLNRLIMEEINYPREQLLQHLAQQEPMLNEGQRITYEAILAAVQSRNGDHFFIDGPGGTGKTFLENILLRRVRADGDVALAVASSGIAGLLLDGGRTAHSRFKLPFKLEPNSVCSIQKQSELAELLRKTSFIIWDEAPMMNRYAVEALDITLQDLRNNTKLFGGVVVAFAGDFRQVLPVKVKASRAEIVASCLKKSYLWPNIRLYNLGENMRARGTQASLEFGNLTFAKWLLKMGENKLPKHGPSGNLITCPPSMIVEGGSVESLIDAIYPTLDNIDDQFLSERAILAPTNAETIQINHLILAKIPGESYTFLSVDEIDQKEGEDIYPTEFLNSLTPSGMPEHNLQLKVGCPIILLRNIDHSTGLCNGTRLIVRNIMSRVIEVRVLGGKHAGNITFIPRITLTTHESLPFELKRVQFPVRVAYAMTINKAQGQTLQHVGLQLEKPVFSHGQLYVAFSRATNPSNVKVLLSNSDDSRANLTKNIVYDEILN